MAKRKSNRRQRSKSRPHNVDRVGIPAPTVNQPELLTDPHHIRGDARMVSHMMSLGVVSAEQSAVLLRRAYELAGKTESPREYAAIMKMIASVAKLEHEVSKPRKPLMDGPQRHIHLHSQLPAAANDGPGTINERRKMLAQITAKLGIPDLAQRCIAGEII